MILISVFLFLKKYEKRNFFVSSYSKETFILINNWFMMFYLITVLLGTLYPIFVEVLLNNKISVGPPFYNSIIIPIAVLFLVLMAIGPKLKWIKSNFENLKISLSLFIAAIQLNILIVYFFRSL